MHPSPCSFPIRPSRVSSKQAMMRRGSFVPAAIPALLLAMLLLSASLAQGRESAWCHDQRKKCERGCPPGSRVKFDCEDQDGGCKALPGRLQGGVLTALPRSAPRCQVAAFTPAVFQAPCLASPPVPLCRRPQRVLRLRWQRWRRRCCHRLFLLLLLLLGPLPGFRAHLHSHPCLCPLPLGR